MVENNYIYWRKNPILSATKFSIIGEGNEIGNMVGGADNKLDDVLKNLDFYYGEKDKTIIVGSAESAENNLIVDENLRALFGIFRNEQEEEKQMNKDEEEDILESILLASGGADEIQEEAQDEENSEMEETMASILSTIDTEKSISEDSIDEDISGDNIDEDSQNDTQDISRDILGDISGDNIDEDSQEDDPEKMREMEETMASILFTIE